MDIDNNKNIDNNKDIDNSNLLACYNLAYFAFRSALLKMYLRQASIP
jgi:hypothetical protein